MIWVDNDMKHEPILVCQGDDEVEILVVEIKVATLTIRLITGFGPQESASKDVIRTFYCRLDEEIESALNNGCEVVLELDANAKLGSCVIEGDPDEMSHNGKQLWNIIERHCLEVVNSSDKCQGLITRHREKVTGIEQSIIDFIIISRNMVQYVEKMEIDDSRVKVLTKFVSKKGTKKIVKSDHNILSCQFNINVAGLQHVRKEIYNVRKEDNLKK